MLENMNKDLILYFVIFIIILFIILLPKIKDKNNNKDKPKQKNQYKTVLIISILIGLMLLYFDAKLGVIVLFLSVIMYYENSDKKDETEENYQEFLGASGRAKKESLTNELKVKNIINNLAKNVKGNFRTLQGQLNIQKKLIEESKNTFDNKLTEAINSCSPTTSTFSDTVEIDTQSGFTDFNMPNPLKESFVKSGVPNIRDLVVSEYIGEEELEDRLPDSKYQKQGPAINSQYLNSNIDKTGTVFYPLN